MRESRWHEYELSANSFFGKNVIMSEEEQKTEIQAESQGPESGDAARGEALAGGEAAAAGGKEEQSAEAVPAVVSDCVPKGKSRAEMLAEARKKSQEEDAKKKAAEAEARKVAQEKHREELQGLRKEAGSIYSMDSDGIDKLSEGFIGLTSPAADDVSRMLSELQAAQLGLVELLAQEDRKVMTLPDMAEVAQALSHVPVYTAKLLEMRQDMDAITSRVKKMRKRAATVYTKKQQEDNSMAQIRQANLEDQKRALESQQK